MQHKLGWFSDVPGLVHCNRDILEILPAHWVQQQSEVAALPTYLPIDLIAEAVQDHEMGELQNHLHHNNYHIEKLDEISNILLNFSKQVE